MNPSLPPDPPDPFPSSVADLNLDWVDLISMTPRRADGKLYVDLLLRDSVTEWEFTITAEVE